MFYSMYSMCETLHLMQAGPGGPLLGGLEQFLDVLAHPDLVPLGPPGVVCLRPVGQLWRDGLVP
jgi:hypothetical protein